MKSVPGTSATLLQQLALLRLEETRALVSSGHFSGAWYISGYVLESALKAVVCRTLKVADYPETALGGRAFKTHAVNDLVLLAGLQAELEAKLTDAAFKANWLTATDWQPEERYRATRTLEDTVGLLQAYEDPENGVLAWLTSRW